MIELKSGGFYIMNEDEPFCEFNNVNGFIESDVDTYSLGQETIKFNNTVSFEAEITNDTPLMAYTTDLTGRPLSIEYRTPIMVQARWHKKPRINKKWLKRYGMKKDSVLVKARADSITFDTERENQYELGYTMTLDDMHYEFRPDQLRRNLKMDVCYES